MNKELQKRVEEAKEAALEVLVHNARRGRRGLPRTAGWGYPEPYTRDLLIASLGVLVSESAELVASLRKVLATLARNQTRLGHIPSLVDDPQDRGASDTTPLFLMALAFYRRASHEKDFLETAAERALTWLAYQSPDDMVLVAQQPTSDWRDEQWVQGFGLFVNTLVYAALRLHGQHRRAEVLKGLMNRFEILEGVKHRHVHEGLSVPRKPYYALWAFKVHASERFDLLGNSLAILTGIASSTRARKLTAWIDQECGVLRQKGQLATHVPPCLLPFVVPGDPDWHRRYEEFNRPGDYHNGGIWPFIGGFYVAALVAAGRRAESSRALSALTDLVCRARDPALRFGFNEWFRAQDGTPQGQDWQTWSAAMYLYAARCVESGATPFFDKVRNANR